METRRCRYCGSQIEMDERTCPYCGSHLELEDKTAPKASSSLDGTRSYGANDSSWVEGWKRKARISKIFLIIFFSAFISAPLSYSIYELMKDGPTEEVCEYSYQFFSGVKEECHTEQSLAFNAGIFLSILVIALVAFVVICLAFGVRTYEEKFGGSTVVVYRGSFGFQLIIDDSVVGRSFSSGRWHRDVTMSGKLANGELLTVTIPCSPFSKPEYIVGGKMFY